MADKQPLELFLNKITEDWKNKIFQKIEATTEPKNRQKTKKELEKIWKDWQDRRLMPGDTDPCPTGTYRARIIMHERGEASKAQADWERKGEPKFGSTKRALQKAEKRMAHVTSYCCS